MFGLLLVFVCESSIVSFSVGTNRFIEIDLDVSWTGF